jgi:hypothetical protein
MTKINRRSFIGATLKTATAAVISTLPAAQGGASESSPVPFEAGFAKADISACIESKTTFRKPLEAICAAIGSKDNQVFIVALDLIQMPPKDCLVIQQEIAEQLGVPAERILIHTTHTHCAPFAAKETGHKIVNMGDTLARCLSQAQSAAKPARIRAGKKDVGKALSVYRRGDAGPELGFQTFWFGYALRHGDPRSDASALANEMKSRWLRKTPDYTPGAVPVWFDGDVDSLVQGIRFEEADGTTIGSIVRFSAHPHLTCACKHWLYDPDYPGVVRDEVEKRTGAPVMFLSGTCANLVPKEKVKYVVDAAKTPKFPYMGPSSGFSPADDNELFAEVRRIGCAVADAAMQGFGGSQVENVTSFKFAARPFDVPLNPDIPRSADEVERLRAPLVAEYEAALQQASPFDKLRGLAERFNRLEWAPAVAAEMLTAEDRNRGTAKLPLSAVSLNSNVFVFMHSEIPAETTFELRKTYPKQNLLTVGLTGGCIGYFPTALMIEQGGYEGRSTIITKDAEENLRRDVAKLLIELNIA